MKIIVFLITILSVSINQARPLESITDLQYLNRTDDQNDLDKLQFLIARLARRAQPALQGAGGNVSGGGGNISGGGGQNKRLFQGSAEDIQKIKAFQLSQLGINSLHEQGFTGKKFRVAIVDSGLNPKNASASHVSYFQDFTGRCPSKSSMCDESGHGSKIAELILQAAPDTSLVVLKTLVNDSQGDFEHLTQSLRWILSNHKKMNIKVVNLSLLSPDRIYGYWNEVDEGRILIKKLSDEGLLLIAAVGNTYQQDKKVDLFPASSLEVIAVGSYSHQFSLNPADRKVSAFSTSGFADQPTTKHSQFLWSSRTEKDFNRWSFKPEILAPGENVLACTEECEFISGTSFSAALLTGALLSQLDMNPQLTRENFLNQQSANCAGPTITNTFDRFVTCAAQFRIP